MPVPKALSAEKHTAILDSAGAAFAAHGYEGASMDAITRAAGVSKATVYNHFSSKAALFGAYVERECERTLAPFFDCLTTPRDIPGTLTVIGRRMAELLLSPVSLAIYRVVVAEAETFPELAQAFYAAGPARAIRVLADWLGRESEAGRLRVDDPIFAAEQFFILCQTRIVLRRRLRLDRDEPPADVERVVAGAVRVFLAAYAVSAHGGCVETPSSQPAHERLQEELHQMIRPRVP